MTSFFKIFMAGLFVLVTGAAQAATSPAAPPTDPRPLDARMADRVLGDPNAPIKVDEFVSLTCSHCAEFYNTVLPTLETKYVDTGKVRFVLHDFPLDGISLKAAAVARCMPEGEYYPFVKILYKNLLTWAFGSGVPENNLVQYAGMAGLPADQAKACMNDSKLQDAIVNERTVAGDKYQVTATPTFVINDGAETIQGAQPAETFAATFDRLLGAQKK